MKTIQSTFLLLFAAAFLFVGCKKNDPVANEIQLSFNGLEDLGSDYVYEGWAIVNGNPVSTGTFTVDENGTPSKTNFMLEDQDLGEASAFVLSIEPAMDSDPAPSAVKILSGDFSNDVASVNTGIVGDFSGSTGDFIIATPTTNSTTDDLSGVWFLNNGAAGLNLPMLPEGWVYEGWAVIGGTPVTTGTFSNVDEADNAAPYSGMDASGPAFPGEDFIMNAPSGLTFPTDLTNAPIVISIEPVPDNSPAPFTLKPLSGASPASGTMVGTPYQMDNNSAGFPTGTATLIFN